MPQLYGGHGGVRRLWLLGIFLSATALGASRMADALDRALRRHTVPNARIGVLVRDLAADRVVFQRLSGEKFEIASNAKLFTTAAALERLGSRYVFKTLIIANGAIRDGCLAGDLVIHGGGDPAISGRFQGGDRMYVPRAMAKVVRDAGITRIDGDLVMDDRFFDRQLRPPGWPEADQLWWYGAPVSALSFNDNCIDVSVTGAKSRGRAPHVSIQPDVGCGRIVNQATTVGAKEPEGLHFSRREDGAVALGGSIRSGKTRGDNIAVENPPLFLGAALKQELARAGVALTGAVRPPRDGEKMVAESRPLGVWETPLVKAVAVANQRSQNFFAEQILKTLSAVRRREGTTQGGIAEIMDFLRSAGLPERDVELADGSGLSEGNCATPAAVVALLACMAKSENGPIFLDSLAVSGDKDTTMRHRLTESAACGQVHAKTGTVKSRGVSACSGYVELRDGRVVAFSVLINGFKPGHIYRAKNAEDAVCRAILGVPDK